MASNSSQKFIAKNRAPRVQIDYDVELYGAEKKVSLPFVMGVMSDLSGKPAEPLPRLEERQMLEISVDNFDDRLKSMKPRVAFNVPNVISGEGTIAVDLTFESLDDFSPAAVTAKVEGLKQLLQARQQLSNLLSYMDGKAEAEELLNTMLKDPALLKALSDKAKGPIPAAAPEAPQA
jgi:type VI secretion system protein ImpB